MPTGKAKKRKWGRHRASRDNRREDVQENHFEMIEVEKILIPKSHTKVDPKIVAEIAESLDFIEIINAIAVRRVGEAIVLVAGAHRLQAAKIAGRKEIACRFVKGDDDYAQLVSLGENLWRKQVSVLDHAIDLVKFLNLASARLNVSGQVGRKGKTGRPPSGVAFAARTLPIYGRTVGARQKIIRRATSISQMCPEAKTAAKRARLHNNQRALLRIAKAGTAKAQLRMVDELAAISAQISGGTDTANKSQARNDDDSVHSVDQQTNAAVSLDDDSSEADDNMKQSERSHTTFMQMEALWTSRYRAAWAYLRVADRERFIELLRRRKCRAKPDILEFLRDVFRGRETLRKQELFAMAAWHGLAKRQVREAVRHYKQQRKGYGMGSEWIIRNPDRQFGTELPVYTKAQIDEAVGAQGSSRDTTPGKSGPMSTGYYDDV
jgi:ParB-like nuclease domain